MTTRQMAGAIISALDEIDVPGGLGVNIEHAYALHGNNTFRPDVADGDDAASPHMQELPHDRAAAFPDANQADPYFVERFCRDVLSGGSRTDGQWRRLLQKIPSAELLFHAAPAGHRRAVPHGPGRTA